MLAWVWSRPKKGVEGERLRVVDGKGGEKKKKEFNELFFDFAPTKEERKTAAAVFMCI